jgi:single stranded DNA-binding protein
MLFKTQLIGNLGKDATVKKHDNGNSSISFPIAVTKKNKNTETTIWINCTMWKRADQQTTIAAYLLKGTKIFTEGEPSVRVYQDNAGNSVATMDLTVVHIELLGGNQTQAQQQQPQHPTQTPRPAPVTTDDDVPF